MVSISPMLLRVAPSFISSDTIASPLYTTTSDSNFVIDVHPDNDRIIIASPCSGHGFKHSAAIGEALSEQVIDGKSKIDVSSFSLKTFKDLIQYRPIPLFAHWASSS